MPSTVRLRIPSKFKPLREPADYKIMYGGRGGAKSRTIAAILVTLACDEKHLILCCREIQLSIKDSVKRVLDNEIERQGLKDQFDSTGNSIINLNTGTEFIFAGLWNNVDNIKSMEGVTICWCEEAHTLSALSIETLIPTIRAAGSEIWMSYNPRFEDDPVHNMFVMNEPPPNSVVIEVNWRDNPWFPDKLRTKMEWDKSTDLDKYLHVWEGKCKKSSEEQVMHGCWSVQETPEPTESTTLRHGLDFGFGTDPLAGVRCWIQGRKLYIDQEVYGLHIETAQTAAHITESIPTMSSWPIIADNARPETISHLNNNGLRVYPAKKGKGSIEDGISFIRSFEVVIHPRCVNVIAEFKDYSYKVDPKTGKILPIIVDAWNHFVDSLRYALEGESRQHNMIEEEQVMEAVMTVREQSEHMFSPIVMGVYTKRFKHDMNVITLRQGLKVLWQQEFDSIKPQDFAFKINSLIREYQVKVCFMNDGGEDPSGTSVKNALQHMGRDNVQLIAYSSAADADNRYYDKISEMWTDAKVWLEDGDIPHDDNLIGDLCGPIRDYDTKGRVKVEKLDDTYKRLMRGVPRAMSLVLTFAVPIIETVDSEELEPEELPAY